MCRHAKGMITQIPPGLARLISSMNQGFGFIKDRDTKQGIFFHVNDVEGEVREGNLVSYEPGMGQKAAVARNVRKYIPEAEGTNKD